MCLTIRDFKSSGFPLTYNIKYNLKQNEENKPFIQPDGKTSEQEELSQTEQKWLTTDKISTDLS